MGNRGIGQGDRRGGSVARRPGGGALNDSKVHYGWVIVLAGMLTLFACLGLARFAFGMLLPSMGKSLHLEYDRMGFIGTGNFAGYLAAVAMAPWFMRRFGGRATITAGLGLVAACMLLIGSSRDFLPVLLLYAMTGIGSGLANVPMMVVVAHWFSRSRRGGATGIMLSGNGFAIIFAGFLVPFLNRSFGPDGWRAGWHILGALSILVAVAAGLLLRNSPAEVGLRPVGEGPIPVPVSPGAGPGAAAFRPEDPGRGTIAHLGILYFLFGLTYMVYGTFIVTTMVAEKGMAEALAGRFWAFVGFFGLFSGPVFGGLSDRIGRKRGFMAVFAVHTVAYGLAASRLGSWALYLSVFLYGISAWSIPTIMGATVVDFFGPERAAAVFSAVTFFFAAGQTLGPGLAGIIAKSAGGFSTSYLLSATATGIAVLLAFLLKPPREEGTVPL